MFNNNKKIIGIIGAMESEVQALRGKLTDAKCITISGIDYYYGEIYNINLVVAKCGIGKVFAAICAQTMILTFHPDIVINTGVGGSLTGGLAIADLAIADKLCQHDMDTTPIGDPLGLISGINRIYFECDETVVADLQKCTTDLGINNKTGVIASGDIFVADKALIKKIVDNFNAIVAEMEGASIAHVCFVNQTKFAVIRSISDCGDGSDYMTNLPKACATIDKVIDEYLKRA